MEKRDSLAPSSANAMLFDGDDFLDAAEPARKFAGKDGRIATLADVVTCRRVSDAHELIWRKPIVTATAEYYGLSRHGTPIIIVAHGNGPLADVDGVFAAYYRASAGGKPLNGLVSQEEFAKLEAGLYGPVEIVARDVVWKRRHPFQECMSVEEAMEDPLLRARLGADADFYLARHRAICLDWLKEKDRPEKTHACMLMSRDPQRRSYLASEPNGTVASAHLLAVSGLVTYDHGHWDDARRHECLVSFLSCHEWGDEGSVIGFRGGHVLRPHPGPAVVRERFKDVWRRLTRPGPPPLPGVRRVYALTETPGGVFTCHEPFIGQAGEPEHPVKGGKPVSSLTFNFPIVGNDLTTPRCDLKAIKANVPMFANAFRIGASRPVWKGDDPSHHEVRVDFYEVDVDHRRRLPTMLALREDFDLLLSLENA